MTKFLILSTLFSLTLAGKMFFGTELKPGDPAPVFSLQGSDGKTHSLSDFQGKKMVVLAWFPKAFTSG